MLEGKELELTAFGRSWQGAPDWISYAEISAAGRIASRADFDELKAAVEKAESVAEVIRLVAT